MQQGEAKFTVLQGQEQGEQDQGQTPARANKPACPRNVLLCAKTPLGKARVAFPRHHRLGKVAIPGLALSVCEKRCKGSESSCQPARGHFGLGPKRIFCVVREAGAGSRRCRSELRWQSRSRGSEAGTTASDIGTGQRSIPRAAIAPHSPVRVLGWLRSGFGEQQVRPVNRAVRNRWPKEIIFKLN